MITEFLKKCEHINLTNTEESIRDYLLKNPGAVENLGVRELADECFVGIASINRFCKKLGYGGYSDFKIAYVKSRKEAEPLRNIDPNVPFRHDTGIDEIISSLPLIYQRAVGFTRIAMNRNTIIRCVERIQQSNVMIFGTGINHLLAETFNYKLEELGMTCKVFDAFHYQYCVSMKKKNARLFAIVLTHSGRNAGMLMVIDRLIEYNIPYVVISGMLTENLKERGSEVIPIIPVSKSRELSNIQYMMSTQYILDILYVALLVKNMKMVENVDEKLNTGKGGNNHAV